MLLSAAFLTILAILDVDCKTENWVLLCKWENGDETNSSGIESIIFLSIVFSLDAFLLTFSDSFFKLRCFIPKRGTFESSKVLKPSDSSG